MSLIEKEVKKLLDAKIIVSLSFSKWVVNLVPVRKKRYGYILQKVVGSQKMSMMNDFSRYNQIIVHPDDREKTTFKTPWGTFM